jgi:CHRD domain.
MKPSRFRPVLGTALLAIAFCTSCDHDKDDDSGPTSIKKWEVTMKAQYEVPAPAGRMEEGEATIELFSDNSLTYDFHIHNLAPSDQLTNAHIHVGDPATSGPVLIPFNPTFTGPGSTGRVTNLRQGQIDTLLAGPVYVNVHSTQVGAGIVRAQLDKTNDFAIDVTLNGDNERPDPVSTTATGQAILRLMTDKTLYSKITVNNIETDDTLTVAHVHRGDVNTAGPVRITLCSNKDDFGTVKSQTLLDSLVNILKNDPCYVNAHSKLHGPGIVRGQIR